MNVIELIREYIEKRDRYNDTKKAITKLENELAVLLSEPKVSNPEAEPCCSTSGSSKILNKIDKMSTVESKLSDNRKLLEMYESSYNAIRNEIIELFKEYDSDKRSCGKDKTMFYIFYYRTFKKYILPFEKIAEILEISTSWCIKMSKDLDDILNNSSVGV